MKAAKRLGPAVQPDDPHYQPDLWTGRANASAELFQAGRAWSLALAGLPRGAGG